jgi:hypothetical protein
VRAITSYDYADDDAQAVDKWSFSFDDPALPVVTTVTDPLNNDSTYTFGRDPASDKPRLEQIDGDCPTCGMGPNTQLRYDDPLNPLKKTMETDGRGHVTLYEYDVHGRLTSRVEAFGTALERETTWEYDPVFPAFVTEIVQPSTTGDPFDERRTVFGYDAFGNQDTRTIEGVERDAAFSYVTATTYNRRAALVSARDAGARSRNRRPCARGGGRQDHGGGLGETRGRGHAFDPRPAV